MEYKDNKKLLDSELSRVVGGILFKRSLKSTVMKWVSDNITPLLYFATGVLAGAVLMGYALHTGQISITIPGVASKLKEFGDPQAVMGYMCTSPVSQEVQWDGFRCGAHATRNLLMEVQTGQEVPSATQLYTQIRSNVQGVDGLLQAADVGFEADREDCRKLAGSECLRSLESQQSERVKQLTEVEDERTQPLLGINEIQMYLQQQKIRTQQFGGAHATVSHLIEHSQHPAILNLGGSHWVTVMGYQKYKDGNVDLFIKDSCYAPVADKSYNRVITASKDKVLRGFLCVANNNLFLI